MKNHPDVASRRGAPAACALGVALATLGVPPARALPVMPPLVGATTTATIAPAPDAHGVTATGTVTDGGAWHLQFGRFGEVQVHRPAQAPTSFTILVAGASGPDAGGEKLVAALVANGSAVVTIDGLRYLEVLNRPGAGCQYLGGDFETLSHEVQRRLGLEEYLLPVLAGYSSGATLAAVVLEQSPKGTYAGLLSIDYQPGLDLRRTPCRGSALAWQPRPGSGIRLIDTGRSGTPWVRLERRGNWLAATTDAQGTLSRRGLAQRPSAPDLHDLPLHEVPARPGGEAAARDWYAVLLTGDGGWAGLDQDVSTALAAAGIPVVALNSLKYFWTARDPDTAARDLGRIVAGYGQRWHRDKVLLIGYSFGADVLPFLYRRLAPSLRTLVGSVNLLAPAHSADFEFHLGDWLPGAAGGAHPTVPEIERMGNARVLCLHGVEDGDSPCEVARLQGLQAVALTGGHHFDGDFDGLAARILRFATQPDVSAARPATEPAAEPAAGPARSERSRPRN